jgi:hypothetical protein
MPGKSFHKAPPPAPVRADEGRAAAEAGRLEGERARAARLNLWDVNRVLAKAVLERAGWCTDPGPE